MFSWLDHRPVLQCAGISVMLNLTVEMLSRRSFIAGLEFLVTDPLLFVYNAAIIMLTLSLSLVFKRRYFVLIILSVVWLVLGTVNCVLLGFRTTPLAAIDFQILNSVDNIITMYLTVIELVLITVAVLGLVVGMVFAWRKSPKVKPRYLTAFLAVAFVTAILFTSTSFLVRAQALSEEFGNLADAYNDYGFAYCFSRSIIDRGIDEPEDYSEENIAQILWAIGVDGEVGPNIKPNIVMVQLESFFDVNYMKNMSFSENPVPTFTALKENFPHGFLTVPSIGAGTANTEFEVLTGMNLGHFGAGEYPYKTVLQDYTCESIPYNLMELGYTSHAIHNHEGTFYQRHTVFSHLGFDTFTSLEYMQDVQYTPLGWAKDEVLTGEIMKALSYTAGQDFVYAISVQAHGKYPEETEEILPIAVDDLEGEGEQAAFTYFINQLNETDTLIEALTAQLAQHNEPVVLVLFGDHLPSLDIENEDLSNEDRFETEYVIWSNFGLETPSRNLSTYQLGAHVLKGLGISNGFLTKVHQNYQADDYQDALRMLEYDMVYGEQYVYGGEGPYTATELHMGVSDILVTGVRQKLDQTYVLGLGFTEWSKVFIDGDQVDTEYIDENTLAIKAEIEAGAAVVVAQIGDNTILSESNSYKCP